MSQTEDKVDFGTRLRRIWNALMHAFEVIDRNPMDDVLERLDRLERDRRAPVALDGHKVGRKTAIGE